MKIHSENMIKFQLPPKTSQAQLCVTINMISAAVKLAGFSRRSLSSGTHVLPKHARVVVVGGGVIGTSIGESISFHF